MQLYSRARAIGFAVNPQMYFWQCSAFVVCYNLHKEKKELCEDISGVTQLDGDTYDSTGHLPRHANEMLIKWEINLKQVVLKSTDGSHQSEYTQAILLLNDLLKYLKGAVLKYLKILTNM